MWFLGRARKQTRHALHEPDELVSTVQRVRRNAQNTIAPGLVVVATVDALWRDAVTQFAALSTVVVMDISEPSESIVWEVQMLAGQRTPTVLIGERSQVETAKYPTTRALL